jgi:hypothetical protein
MISPFYYWMLDKSEGFGSEPCLINWNDRHGQRRT